MRLLPLGADQEVMAISRLAAPELNCAQDDPIQSTWIKERLPLSSSSSPSTLSFVQSSACPCSSVFALCSQSPGVIDRTHIRCPESNAHLSGLLPHGSRLVATYRTTPLPYTPPDLGLIPDLASADLSIHTQKLQT